MELGNYTVIIRLRRTVINSMIVDKNKPVVIGQLGATMSVIVDYLCGESGTTQLLEGLFIAR